MNSTNIYHINEVMQQRHDGKVTMQGIALTNLIHNVIREYGKYDSDSYSVFMSDIDLCDRKLLLSHVLDSGEYEWALESESRIQACWDDNCKYIESLIDDESREVYREDMEERGMTSRHHSDNNEVYWVRR